MVKMRTYIETVSDSINHLMKKNKKCIYIGEDVRNGQRAISENFVKCAKNLSKICDF